MWYAQYSNSCSSIILVNVGRFPSLTHSLNWKSARFQVGSAVYSASSTNVYELVLGSRGARNTGREGMKEESLWHFRMLPTRYGLYK